MFKSLSVITFVAAAIAPSFAQSVPDASAERGIVSQWAGGTTTRAQVRESVLQAREGGTLSYVGDQPVFRTQPLARSQAQTMGYGAPASGKTASPYVSHDGYRLVGDVHIYEPRK